jgi:phage replication-related protein YjqB (UPF0714/DUF867 family)
MRIISFTLSDEKALRRVRRSAEVIQFLHGHRSTQQPQSAIGRCHQACAINITKRIFQPCFDLINRLHMTPGDSHYAENRSGFRQPFLPMQVVFIDMSDL